MRANKLETALSRDRLYSLSAPTRYVLFMYMYMFILDMYTYMYIKIRCAEQTRQTVGSYFGGTSVPYMNMRT